MSIYRYADEEPKKEEEKSSEPKVVSTSDKKFPEPVPPEGASSEVGQTQESEKPSYNPFNRGS